VNAHLELLARLLVHVNRAVHGVLPDPGRQEHGARNEGAGALGRLDDLRSGLVYEPVVIRVQTNADALLARSLYVGFIFSHIFTL